MIWNKHSDLEGKHAILGASKYYWLGYTPEKIEGYYRSMMAKEQGTELHAFAAQCIKLNQKLPRSNKTLNRYVNDAIGFKMSPEVILYYSRNCFGTADAIVFRDMLLRIHDLKTGNIIADMRQLKIYAALFCLEYRINPLSIKYELRIYQNDDFEVCNPDPEEIKQIMEHIIECDKIIEDIKRREG